MEHDSVGEQDEFEVYNREMCEKQVSPALPFKIISALMGLENHVIEDENSTMNYDGTQYPSGGLERSSDSAASFWNLLYLVFPAG